VPDGVRAVSSLLHAPVLARDVPALRAAIGTARTARSGRVGFVPTMGALHAGHRALVERARRECAVVVASVFVNPSQFNDATDLARYPRDEEGDVALLAAAGADVVYLPTPDVVYPPGFSTWVDVEGLTGVLEGAHRPGHFRGVATVVTHLLRAADPDVAYFGEKDWQQLQVIRRLARDLWLDVVIASVPTVRDDDGLALSSRNARLDADARRAAGALPAALRAVQQAFAAGERSVQALEGALRDVLERASGVRVDYACVVHAESLAPIVQADGASRALVAAHVGGVRLIDNAALGEPLGGPS
jgi:pantoate--beta-alanine ligase